jgi:hypothetical protein
VAGVFFQDFRYGQPVFVELRGQFDEIARDRSAGHGRPGDFGQHAVQRMAEFVKQRACLVERQKRRLASRRFGEIHYIEDNRRRALAKRPARLQPAHPGTGPLRRAVEIVG